MRVLNPINSLYFANMVRKLFVGGLPYRTTGDELKDAFAKAGEVATASIVTDRETGRSRGFGFVEMADDAGADAAISMWNGKEFDGRTLTVSDARPKA
jgi:RNA recognition motif-containing protein